MEANPIAFKVIEDLLMQNVICEDSYRENPVSNANTLQCTHQNGFRHLTFLSCTGFKSQIKFYLSFILKIMVI